MLQALDYLEKPTLVRASIVSAGFVGRSEVPDTGSRETR
jgi:hypothetical protein